MVLDAVITFVHEFYLNATVITTTLLTKHKVDCK